MERKWEGTGEDAEDEDKENRRIASEEEGSPVSPPPPNQLAQGKEKGRQRKERVYSRFLPSHKPPGMIMSDEEVIEVTEEMEKEITKMQQKGGDTDEWEAFQERGGPQRAKKKADWF